ncbi:hypothetical protein [Vibrio cholerae]|uniref:hypothetical protein n=1 Tax=Vibrio cholerae TaxID=666 RepID=UPI0006814F3B|nr:hypothetical protein [Vibrio cholerae]
MKKGSPSTIQELIELATQIVGRHDNVVLSHTSLSALPESDHQTLTIYVECLPEKCFDLNWELSAALVEAELDEVGCVVHFEICWQKMSQNLLTNTTRGALKRCNMEELLTQIHNETGKLNSLKSQPPTESNSEIIKAQEQVLDSLISEFDSVMEAKQKSGLNYLKANQK